MKTVVIVALLVVCASCAISNTLELDFNAQKYDENVAIAAISNVSSSISECRRAYISLIPKDASKSSQMHAYYEPRSGNWFDGKSLKSIPEMVAPMISLMYSGEFWSWSIFCTNELGKATPLFQLPFHKTWYYNLVQNCTELMEHINANRGKIDQDECPRLLMVMDYLANRAMDEGLKMMTFSFAYGSENMYLTHMNKMVAKELTFVVWLQEECTDQQ